MNDAQADSPRAPVVLLGFDAAEVTVIDRLVAAGKMPNMAALRKRGLSGGLKTEPAQFLSNVWTTAFTSTGLGRHGWFCNKQWNGDRQYLQYPNTNWLPRTPFWDELDEHLKVTLFDIPFAVELPSGKNQRCITGWQCHADFGESSKPAKLYAELTEMHGRPIMTPEVSGPQTASTLLASHREMQRTMDQFGDIVATMVAQDKQDLVFAVSGSMHRAGHYLWDLSQIDTIQIPAHEKNLLEGALDASYRKMDETLGKVVEALPDNAMIFAFALHGMGPNHGWQEKLSAMVERVHQGRDKGSPPSKGLLYRLKNALPMQLVRQITRRLPARWNQALIPLWSKRMYDWNSTRFFAIPQAFSGYVRLNIKGREAQGCLNPDNVEAEIERLIHGLQGFRDIKTGRRIIDRVQRIEDIVHASHDSRHTLPDLAVSWAADFPTAQSIGIFSDSLGEIRWPEGQKLSTGRSGSHTANGWFVAAGPGIRAGVAPRAYSTVDVIPTVLHWLGAKPHIRYEGSVIDALAVKGKTREPLREQSETLV